MATPMLSGHGAGMSDYLTNLLIRTRCPERTIQPRLSSIFDPISPGSMGGGVGGWGSEEETYPVVQVDQSVPRHGLSEGQSLQNIVDGPEVARPSSEQAIQQRELPLESTVARERRDSYSATVSSSELNDVAVEDKPVLGQLRTRPKNDGGIPSSRPHVPLSQHSTAQLSHVSAEEITVQHCGESTTPEASDSMDSDPRPATSRRNQSEDKAVSLSPIDRSIVGQEETAPLHKPAAQSRSSPLRVSSDETTGSARSRTAPLIEELASEQSAVSSTGAEPRPRDREPDDHVAARGAQIRALSSPRPLVGAPAVLGDDEPSRQAPPSAAVSEPERTIPTSRGAAVGEMPDLSALSLDPSLVIPAPAVKAGVPSLPITSRKGEDLPVMSSSPADREQPTVPSHIVPMASKTFIAAPRVAVPRAVATVNHGMAADGAKPAEPVVQVTIGRVEVRAVAPPVRQERGRKPQSAMSLDDYLKRRGGRSGG